ncbi:hypothetical protein ACFOOM_16730 [Streptomyces echinoruber]|uniref:hypothetical protein n=1 Tax=Streptomyces echinoruber TaxID=68898 RepID=UPI00167EE6CA|nr:hypothetical protein [Streptomyces echinoruber]
MTLSRRTRGPSRRAVRVATAAAALAGALALTACSGGSGDSAGGSPSTSGTAATASAGASASASADTGGGTGATPSAGDKLQGSWLATTGGKAVVLVFNGEQAGLFTTGGTMCSGTVEERAGRRTIHLQRTAGNRNRVDGVVDSVGRNTLKVTWEGYGRETFRRAEGGRLPTGLPTAGSGS